MTLVFVYVAAAMLVTHFLAFCGGVRVADKFPAQPEQLALEACLPDPEDPRWEQEKLKDCTRDSVCGWVNHPMYRLGKVLVYGGCKTVVNGSSLLDQKFSQQYAIRVMEAQQRRHALESW